MIKVNNLSYTYPDTNKQVLHNVTFEVQDGEIFGFLGPSGAGKSTTQKVLNGLLKNYKGEVRVNNCNLKSISQDFYEELGVAFEFPNLYEKLTARENLDLFASLYKKGTADPEHLLEQVNLADDMHTRVSAFSKGMKMRLNFIRALLNKPRILFLDEPTSGLDPVNARRVKDMILQMRDSGTTIFLTTHNMNDADELCDRLAFMVEGRLPVIDSPGKLKVAHGKKKVCISVQENGKAGEFEFDLHGLDINKEFQHLLAGGNIETIHTLEASLEDVFIKLTGKTLL